LQEFELGAGLDAFSDLPSAGLRAMALIPALLRRCEAADEAAVDFQDADWKVLAIRLNNQLTRKRPSA